VEIQEQARIIWSRPSLGSSGSMPLGNGDLGVNLWVEEDGDLLFYIGKTDAWSENARLLKLGRVRVSLEPNPFSSGSNFSQVLEAGSGEIRLLAGHEKTEIDTNIRVDANDPAVSITGSGSGKFDVRVALETWRNAKREITGPELFSAYGLQNGPGKVSVYPDTVMPGNRDRITWYHHNGTSMWRRTLQLQGMVNWANGVNDPLKSRIFGGVITGRGLVSRDPRTLVTRRPSSELEINVYCLTACTPDPGEWIRSLESLVTRNGKTDAKVARAAHLRWWKDFWTRSWIQVKTGDSPSLVSRGYALQRYTNGCAGRGNFPVKFNGSIFTVDADDKDHHYDADYRRWGGPYWFQNTRLIYWSMLASGDFDLMEPLFRMYMDALPLARERTRLYFKHGGAYFPETMYFWGSYANDNYGWDREGKEVSHIDNRFIRWHYESSLELLAIMLEYHEYRPSPGFLANVLLPMADEVLAFFSEHFPREGGLLVLEPSQALETYQEAVNPTDQVAGLRWVLGKLITLGSGKLGSNRDARWRDMLGEVPPLPVEGESLSPAGKILMGPNNSENPELYAIFPFSLLGVGKPDLELGRETYHRRKYRGNSGWQQDEVHAAMLGLAREASEGITERFSQINPGSRFPAFWGPNFDWIPDQDHGCSGMIALQRMLLQCDGKEILLFPAWPSNWDVEFKLHAPFNTQIEGSLRNGGPVDVTVSPSYREKDVQILEPQSW